MPLMKSGDLNGFWALFADNLANMVLIATVCTTVFKMPNAIVYGRILPGVGVALMCGLSFYFLQAWRLARRENRTDVTALPYGISTPILFVYLFGVIGPVYWATENAVCAWQVGVAAAFLAIFAPSKPSIAARTAAVRPMPSSPRSRRCEKPKNCFSSSTTTLPETRKMRSNSYRRLTEWACAGSPR